MKFAFIAQTAYQLMNLIKFVYYNTEDSKGQSVIFISDKVSSDLADIRLLTDSGLFNRVIIYKKKQYKENKIAGKIDTLSNMINRNSFRKLLTDSYDFREAEIVVVPTSSLESQMFWQYIKHKKVYLIEDGLGSLTGNIVEDGMRKSRKILTNLLYGTFTVDKMYLNNLAFNNSVSNIEIEEIPGVYNKELCAFLKKVFLPSGYGRTYNENDVIYLQQPVTQWSCEYVDLEKQLLQRCFEKLGDRFKIRCHPVTVGNPRIKGISYDIQNYAWEALCIEEITDKSILMGVFSTAQYSPKQIFNSEPSIIFIHRIIKPTNIEQAEIERMIEVLRTKYSDKSKIYMPDSIDELLYVLDNILI